MQLPSPQPCVEDAAVATDYAGAKAIDLFLTPPPMPRARPSEDGPSRGSAEPTQPLTTSPSGAGVAAAAPAQPQSGQPRQRIGYGHPPQPGSSYFRGLFFTDPGGLAPPLQVYRTRDANQNRQLVIDVMNARIDPTLTGDSIPSGVYGVRRWHMTQFRTNPPAVRITMTLDQVSPDWQVIPLNQGGLMLAPVGMAARQIPSPPTTVVLPVIRNAPGAATAPRPPAAGSGSGSGATLMAAPAQAMTSPPGPVANRRQPSAPGTSPGG